MEIIVQRDGYVVKLVATENIEIKINGNIAYAHTVAADKEATINFDMEERTPITE